MPSLRNEIILPVQLCDAQGGLNPDAVGWGRHPVWDCNLRGRSLRKKQWDYWCIMGPDRLFSVCLANIDYAGLAMAYLLDYETRHMVDCGVGLPFLRQPAMPRGTYGDTLFQRGGTTAALHFERDAGTIRFATPKCEGKPLTAEFHIAYPAGLESLNVVVPWSARNFQFTSKQLALPVTGEVRWGDEVWTFDRETSFAVRDFGRGVWPYRTSWNWAAIHERQDGGMVAVNLGGQWTDGTGQTENGLLLNGVLYPIDDRVVFDYDPRDPMKPWHLHSDDGESVDLAFTPFFDRHNHMNLGILYTDVHQCFGRFKGVVRAGGHAVQLVDALGWAEEHHARW
jgi:hypothetical protein